MGFFDKVNKLYEDGVNRLNDGIQKQQENKEKAEKFRLMAKEVGIMVQEQIHIVGGNQLVGTANFSKMIQLKDKRIYFSGNYEDAFSLVSLVFDGPKYRTVREEKSNGSNHYTEETNTKKKGKAGKVVAGALIGSIIAPGIGTAVGAYAGSKGKTKTKTIKKGNQNHQSHVKEETFQQEEKAVCYLELIRLRDNESIKLSVEADSKDYHRFLGFALSDSSLEKKDTLSRSVAIEKLKELKELNDLGIITDEEFAEKRKAYLDYI
ncbi:SHOCT domain-containing protein [uncultured Enterococcus sp.]|uniref:SHOCT domain-containing protein n=1 Tax=uncultured Enterococcus sp. TaxID=167972 RepID=UPI0026220F84|nr:SHOCT domain-containing protein [uncultured Enterococcus sp.]